VVVRDVRGGATLRRVSAPTPTPTPAPGRTRLPHLTAVLRGGDEDRVTPLELFFDLVFVLALSQCTTLMYHGPTWLGVLHGLLALGVLWWAWVGYSWLTSVVDPEEGTAQLAMFLAMAGFLVAALCVPLAFGREALLFACAYAVVRVAHVALFFVASRDDPGLRRSIIRLGLATAVGVGLLFAAALASGTGRTLLWVAALALDMGGVFVIEPSGWRLVPAHFAERHGAVLLIALGESVVAVAVASEVRIGTGVVVASVLGFTVIAALWWLYFDVVALVAARRLGHAAEGRERNALARDSFSFLHLPMVAGIDLFALGLKETLSDVDHRLAIVPAVALVAGPAIYLLAHVAFRWRNVHRFSGQRVLAALACLALIPASRAISALATLALLAAILLVLVTYERLRFAELRARLRATPASARA